MRFFKYLFILLALLFIVGSFYITTLKSDYTIAKNQLVKAPKSVIYDEISTCRNWNYWNLYTEKGSEVTPQNEAGKMMYSWENEDKKGEIYMISTNSDDKITQKISVDKRPDLNFDWNLKKTEYGTQVTLTVKGKKTFLDKVYELAQFEMAETNEEKYQKGLRLLAQHLQEKMEEHSITTDGITDVSGTFYLYVTRSSKLEKMTDEMQKSLSEITKYMEEKGISSSGKPFSLCHQINEQEGTILFSCCVPIRERMMTSNNVLVAFLKPQRTFKTTLKGSYQFLEEAWNDVHKSIAERGLKIKENGEPFGIYTVGMNETSNPTKWITEIYIPIQQD
ncbi:MAG: effector binding domain-containing protein [Flavobacteriaceae bacterium]|nr:effector binding domain-containing protein [Flavobacteriaceae bacterium]